MTLSSLVTLSISSLRNLDIKANKFYDRAHRLYDAALLTRCYTQHALRPYKDSKINHIRHFTRDVFYVRREVDLMQTAKVNAYFMHIFGKIELLSIHET